MKNLITIIAILISVNVMAQESSPNLSWFKDNQQFNTCIRLGVDRMNAEVREPSSASALYSLSPSVKSPVKFIDEIGNIDYYVWYGYNVDYKPGLGADYFAQVDFCSHTVPANSPTRDYASSNFSIIDTRPTKLTKSCGSVIDFAKKTVAEAVPIYGTNLSLNYSSEFNTSSNINRKIANNYSFFYNVNSTYRVEHLNAATGLKLTSSDYPTAISHHFSSDFIVPSSSTLWVNDAFKSVAKIRTVLSAVENDFGGGCTYWWDESATGTLTLRSACGLPIVHTFEIESVVNSAIVYRPEVWGLNGWTVSVHHYFDKDSLTLFSGEGERVKYTTVKNINDPILGQVNVVINKYNEQELFIFDQQGRHLETRDVILGQTIDKFSYDSSNKLVSISDRFNSKTNFIYSGGVLQKIVSPFGVETKFQISQSRLSKVFDPDSINNNLSYEMIYDNSGLLTSYKSINGVITDFTYNSDGEFLREDKNIGLIQYFTQAVIDGVVVLTKNLNFGLSRKLQIGSTENGSEVNELDQNDNLISQELRSHVYNVTQFNFDKDQSSEVFILSNEWGKDKLVVNQSVRQITESDQNVTDTTEYSEQRIYGEGDNVLKLLRFNSITSNQNYNLQTSFNKTSNVLTATDNIGNSTTLQFNNNNLLSRISSVDTYPTDFQYDDKGRLTKVLKGTQFESYSYDVNGYVASNSNNKNQVTQFIRNKKGKLLKKILPNQDAVEFEYTDGGEVKKIIAPNGQIHNFQMSLGDYVTQAITPNSKTTVYDYDSDKRLKSVVKPSGKSLVFEYEPGKAELKKISTPNGPIVINERDIRSRVKSITSSDNIRTDIAWASNQVQSQAWYDNGQPIGKLSVNFADEQFKIKSIYLNDELIASYSYQNGVLSSIDNLGFSYSNQFGDHARVQTITNNSGFSIEYTEIDTMNGDQPEQLISAQVYDGPESQLYITLKRAYDSFGQATEFTTTTLNQSTGTYNSYFSLIPVYDVNNRLVQLNKTRKSYANGMEVNSLDFVNQYLYPPKSNNNVKTYQQSISVNHTQSPIKRTTASHNADDQLTKLQGSINRDYKYDEDGNLSEMTNCYGTTTHEYDAFGNLKKVMFPGNKIVEYKVDAFNRRFKKLVNGQVAEYYLWYDQIRLAAILDGNKNPKVIYVYGSESSNVPGYVVKDGKTYKIIHDPGTQSVRYIVDSENAMIVQESEYDEHGNVMKNTNAEFQPLGFAGGLYDADTKFVRFGARDYDPTIGRWTTKDPIGFAGGDTNLYAYVGGDPMSYVDPQGTDANMVQDGIHTYLEVGQPGEPITRLELGPAQTSTFDLIMNRPVEGEVSVTNMTGTKFTPNKSTIKLTAKQDLAIINRAKELKKKFFTGQRKYQWSPNTGSNCQSFAEELLEGSK